MEQPPYQPSLSLSPSREQELLAEIERLKGTQPAAAALARAKQNFSVPEGEEAYVHALVTHKNGVAVPNPQTEPFHPAVYRTLAAVEGFKAEVLHDPATAKAAASDEPR
jgi:hypothetical protein